MDVQGDDRTKVERVSDREMVVTRMFAAPVHIVFEAWRNPALFQRWWVPKSCGVTMVSCEMDVRTGGSYKLMMKHSAAPEPMPFFGRYTEVVPDAKIQWTNEEDGEGGAVTTVTFEDRGGETLVVMHDLHASKEALDAAIENGSTSFAGETFAQLDAVVADTARA